MRSGSCSDRLRAEENLETGASERPNRHGPMWRLGAPPVVLLTLLCGASLAAGALALACAATGSAAVGWALPQPLPALAARAVRV